MKTNNEDLNKLYRYIVFFGIVAVIVGVLIMLFGFVSFKELGFYLLGLVLGIFMAIFWAYDIYNTLDIGLDKDQESASKYMKKRSIIRMLVIIAIIILGGYLSLNMIVGTMVGLISLKISAYVQALNNKQK